MGKDPGSGSRCSGLWKTRDLTDSLGHFLLSLRVSLWDLGGGGWTGRAGSRAESTEQGVEKDPLAKAQV